MKHFFKFLLVAAMLPFFNQSAKAQGWPENYEGVMLQGFFWDSFTDTQWSNLTKQADEISRYFSLVWVPQSGNCNTGYNNMGYMPVYWFEHTSSFGDENDLRKMIETYKSKGTGIIADVVINHRNNLGVGGSWVDFPAETYKGVTYQMQPTDICANDDGGNTRNWANGKGIQLSSNNDTGEDWSGCRDLDHKSTNVQKCVDVYLDFLLRDLGYTGFRYDMTKGYSASFTGQYNNKAKPQFSVGEYWDGNSDALKSWLNGTKVGGAIQSATFDFAFRYTVRDAINGNDWTKLQNSSLMGDANYRRYAVTFVENHDTQFRSSSEQQDPIRKDTLAANAYLLAMPGTPCVFLPHWKAYKQDIKAMIDVRKQAGITNQSSYSSFASNKNYQAYNVKGKNADLLVCVGNGATSYSGNNRYTEILSGYHYRYFLSNTANTAWADKASGEYGHEFNVKLSAVTADSNAQIVYTLDGSTPTANSTKAANGTSIKISETCVLTVGILTNGVVNGIVKREYTVKPFVAHTATVYFKNPNWTTPVYFYAWDSNSQLNGSWPGKVITEKQTIGGVEWYYQTFDINKEGYTFNIIFDQGQGKKQTVDIGPISEDTYFELSKEVNGKFTVNDITEQYTSGVGNVIVDFTNNKLPVHVYSVSGALLRTLPAGTSVSKSIEGLQNGIYIINGKKVKK